MAFMVACAQRLNLWMTQLCNIYFLTPAQEAIRRLFAVRRHPAAFPTMATVVALVAFYGNADATPLSCLDSPSRLGACFTVHGRLTACTAVPSVRIWVVGTRRVLGVEDVLGNPGGEPLLPKQLEQKMLTGTPCMKATYGDFTVCPLTRARPGVMRRVCVESAKITLVQEDR